MPFKVETWYYPEGQSGPPSHGRSFALRKGAVERIFRDAEGAGLHVRAVMEFPPGKCARATVRRISEAEFVRLARAGE